MLGHLKSNDNRWHQVYSLKCLTSIIFVGVDEFRRSSYKGDMTPEQCRAGRGFLDWSQADLADAARVSLSTVRDYEKGRRTPIQNNLAAMEAALASQGVIVSFENGAQKVTFSRA